MPYNTKTIKRDSQNIPVPQIFNPSIDDFSALTGVDLGGGRVGADNLMWGKTAGGLYVPVKVSDAGAVATELTGRKLRLVKFAQTYSTQVATNVVITITPTIGFIARLKALGYYAPAVVGSTGSHYLKVGLTSNIANDVSAYSIIEINAVGTNPLLFRPFDNLGYKDTIFTTSEPLYVSYIAPGTNPQIGTRTLFVLWEEEAII